MVFRIFRVLTGASNNILIARRIKVDLLHTLNTTRRRYANSILLFLGISFQVKRNILLYHVTSLFRKQCIYEFLTVLTLILPYILCAHSFYHKIRSEILTIKYRVVQIFAGV